MKNPHCFRQTDITNNLPSSSVTSHPTPAKYYTQIMSFSSLILMPNCPKWPQRDGKRILGRRNLMCLLIFSYASNSSLMMSTSYSKISFYRCEPLFAHNFSNNQKYMCFPVYDRHAMTKHQYYLQMRKDILEERMRCDTENALLLASLALQAEFSDYQPEVQNLCNTWHPTTTNNTSLEYWFKWWNTDFIILILPLLILSMQ